MPIVASLSKLRIKQLPSRFWFYFLTPAWVSAAASLVTVLSNQTWSKVLVAGVMGQLALTAIKLLTFLGVIVLGLAASAYKISPIHSGLRWIGDRLATVSFDYSSAAIGVLCGILPVGLWQSGFGVLSATAKASLILLGAQGILWFMSNLAYGKLTSNVGGKRWLVAIYGLVFSILFIFGISQEPWKEVQDPQSPCDSPSIKPTPLRGAA
ncbi:hypothetical protein [Xanthomonas campestris]|jgi:hypothetical protein|uniref:hypothetical protein n=1 Tax=Xanthomonas campestris TaxID=339 RepID=UPI0005DF5CFE|nr:hypothetical protein [Xanthomonas campestris]MCC5053226.1 hypothetical protein [Xanthomonas campestris pv. aberrans]MCF8869658.1 hypothetical protein [Xanthomonas campestris pv. campestris]MDM7671927.1 hypothetical protein [Xanthomonas campestris pv. campestris]MDM7674826.1 hypothetical protein [Xanthomonas campestris pv. campestris]MDM7678728.1 hypothetical protein [Xanthomonas campestris pv. campestris]